MRKMVTSTQTTVKPSIKSARTTSAANRNVVVVVEDGGVKSWSASLPKCGRESSREERDFGTKCGKGITFVGAMEGGF